VNKKLTFIQKVKIFRMWSNEQKGGVVVACNLCDSTHLSFKNQHNEQLEDKHMYTSTYICEDCGATCQNKQEWVSQKE